MHPGSHNQGIKLHTLFQYFTSLVVGRKACKGHLQSGQTFHVSPQAFTLSDHMPAALWELIEYVVHFTIRGHSLQARCDTPRPLDLVKLKASLKRHTRFQSLGYSVA